MSEMIYIALSEPVVRLDVSKILGNIGFKNITSFTSCERMLEQTMNAQPPPDLIILESFFKKDSDGILAAKHIRKKYDVPLLFLTSRHSEEIGKNDGLSKCIYLAKPFEEESLVNSVKNLLNYQN